MERVDAVVIGAGVVGLAVARALAQRGLETVVLEREASIGTGTSSRNSEVVHAGLYYAKGSLKAALCVRGKHLLYAHCAARGVPHRRCGKFVVATSAEQVAALEALAATARANGVPETALLTAAQARQVEPQLACVAALDSQSTGIVDSHALMQSFQGELEAAGGVVAFGADVRGGEVGARNITLHVHGDEPMDLEAGLVVNSAGLHAQAIASSLAGMPAAHVPPAHFAKGNYYSLAGRSPFSRLVYPVPEPGGLGVHLTVDLGGQARFGPDVEWVDAPAYGVDPRRADAFYAAIRRYWPGLPDGTLHPAYAGVRPKLSGPGEPAADFLVQGPEAHGVPGLVHLFGIESPGLTASMAIAEAVVARV